ncbi:MAG: class I SAM-dependent methyltransferase [Chloroflexi bacterium]|nr:class I SAM-dependent methyltransferase [Chloroflexota bacterium]
MTTLKNNERLSTSFRDPSGFLFARDEKLYRQVNHSYSQDYTFLIESGLYDRLLKANLLIPHTEVGVQPIEPKSAFKVICPEQVRFISYPYEWSFSQLKDAALATIAVQKHALKFEMSLKDASAYNIQFHKGKPILIDTLSFEVYKDGAPWVAYRQFCQHFLAPLALMAKTDVRLSQLMRVYIDGVPLDLASRLLPASTCLNFGLLTHIHLHARAQMRYADAGAVNDRLEKTSRERMTKQALQGLIESLENTVKQLEWKPVGTEWGDYYNMTNYTDSAFEHKKNIISEWVRRLNPRQVWDVGANNGVFTRLASAQGIPAIAFDIDPAAVEQNYRQVKSARETNILPLVQDLTNPSPSLGWHTRERNAFLERAPADMVFALAVIHHLAISNNVPLYLLADFFHDLGKWLVIEFVPKTDSQVQKLLASRLDIFDQYTVDDFERIFGARFAILEKVKVRESERFLYLMEKRD